MKRDSVNRLILYILIVVFLVIDYLSLSSGLQVIEDLKSSGAVNYLMPIVFVAIQVTAVFVTGAGADKFRFPGIIPIFVAIAAGAVYFSSLSDALEKTHFLEYEIITMLFYRAIWIDVKGLLVYPLTILGALLLGMAEELFQAFYPDRPFDTGDIKINLFSSILMVLVIFAMTKRPKAITKK